MRALDLATLTPGSTDLKMHDECIWLVRIIFVNKMLEKLKCMTGDSNPGPLSNTRVSSPSELVVQSK